MNTKQILMVSLVVLGAIIGGFLAGQNFLIVKHPCATQCRKLNNNCLKRVSVPGNSNTANLMIPEADRVRLADACIAAANTCLTTCEGLSQ